MADVRLTAINPEDSSVVPVTCDASGRLLLEERGVGPQGPPGPQGEPGQDGDPFSGNFDGDVTFGGSAEFAADVKIGSSALATGAVVAQSNNANQNGGTLVSQNFGTAGPYKPKVFAGRASTSTDTSAIYADGGASFAGAVMVSDDNSVTSTTAGGTYIADYGQVVVNSVSETPSSDRVFLGKGKNVTTSEINADGSVNFASRKAGFTAEGYLWCTTRRGDTVILDFTSNGAGQWVEYTPTTRREDIRDNLDAIRGDTGEMPSDTP